MARAVYDFQSPTLENRDRKEPRGRVRGESCSSTTPRSSPSSTPWCVTRPNKQSTRCPTLRADEIANAARYERTGERKAFRAGHCERGLTARDGRLESRVPKPKGAVFESAVIERYRRREQSVEESSTDIYPAGVSTRQVDDTGQLPCVWAHALADIERQAQEGVRGDRGVAQPPVGVGVPVRVHGRRVAQTLMGRLGRERRHTGRHRHRPRGPSRGDRRDGGHERGQDQLGAVRPRHDRTRFERRRIGGRRPLRGTRVHRQLHATEREMPAVHGAFHAQRALEDAAKPPRMAVFAMESRESALAKAWEAVSGMEAKKLRTAANCLGEGIGETAVYLLAEFPDGHRRRIRANDMIERLNREIRHRTRVMGGFPDGDGALMLICARIRYVTANEWSTRP